MGTWLRRLVVVCILAPALRGQSQDLTALSLEDFMNIEVTTVRKSSEKIARTAAAVFVITREDIRRSGASNLPEVLRLAPGVHVAQISGTSWAIGIRGFNNIYSNKLLVMIDGRTIYNALLSGVLWSEDIVMLDDVERIEVIRGPGATMWGANAVSGVINIITRNAKDTEGGLAAVSAGNFDQVNARLRYGQKLGRNGAWRAWTQYSRLGQTPLMPGPSGLVPWSAMRGGVRLDWARDRESVLVEGEVQRDTAETLPTAAGGAAPRAVDSGATSGYVMARWDHTTRRGDQIRAQIYENEDALNGGTFTARIHTLDLDVQDTIPLSHGHQLMIGGGGRWNRIETVGTPQFQFEPANATYRIFNAFAQDEWELVKDRLLLTVGAKLERYTMAGSALEPTVRVAWTPAKRQTYWFSASRAVRTPAHTDYSVRVPIELPGLPFGLLLMGSDQFRPEVLRALDAGARFQPSPRWAIDLAVFRDWYGLLHSYRISLPGGADLPPGMGGSAPFFLPAVTSNGLNGLNQGGEATVEYDVRPGWRLSGNYSFLSGGTSFRPGFDATNSFAFPDYTPKHDWRLRSSWDFRRVWEVDLTFSRVGALGRGALPAHSQVDCRIGRKLGEFAELSISGRNLLRPYQQEFVGQLIYPAGLVPRSVEAGVRWRF